MLNPCVMSLHSQLEKKIHDSYCCHTLEQVLAAVKRRYWTDSGSAGHLQAFHRFRL